MSLLVIQKQSLGALTEKEVEVVYWLGHGKTRPEIAKILNVSVSAVKAREERAREKLNVSGGVGHLVVAAICTQALRPLVRVSAIILLCSVTMFTPPRIAPKSAPKRQHTEQVVRRALPKYDIEQYQAA